MNTSFEHEIRQRFDALEKTVADMSEQIRRMAGGQQTVHGADSAAVAVQASNPEVSSPAARILH